MLNTEYKTITRPWLVQRGSFRDLEEKNIIGLDSLISYDYMGSSEFEFGALGFSLKRMTHSWKEYEWFPIDSIKDSDGNVLYVLCRKNQKEDVITVLKLFASEKCPYLKESVGLYDYITCRSDWSLRINFWWDVTSDRNAFDDSKTGNDWMACFGNDIRRLVIAINKVCEKHNVSPKGPKIPPISNKAIRPNLHIEHDHSLIKVFYSDGTNTTIVKRKIISVKEDTDRVQITVKAKSGSNKEIVISIPPSSTRVLLMNILKDWPEINKRNT